MKVSVNSRILLVDDEEGIRITLSYLLRKEGYHVDTAASYGDASVCLQTVLYDLAFIDIVLAGQNGINVLRDIKAISPTTQVVMITGNPNVKTAAEAVRLGAYDYITKPVQRELLLSISRLALTAKKVQEDQELYRANLDAIFRSVSDSIIMIDQEGRLAQFNPPAGKIFGYTRDMIGNEVAEIELPSGVLFHPVILEALHTGAPKELRRFECQMPAGKKLVVNLTATPVTETNGTVSGAVAVIRDVTRLVELEQSLKKRSHFKGIVGVSAPMQRLYGLIEALADVPTTVLIYGESGTGKESVAAALHFSGGRASGAFVKVNCSALSESLMESELFGHVRGAFTGAIADKIGRFQKADGGTLFLDEIGDISPAVQMRLLRVLQESEFERVGESAPTKVDVRVIAASNKDLVQMVKQGSFRKDLYYRLNVVRLVVPSLSERLDDLDLLVAHFITKSNKRLKKNIQGVSADTINIFMRHTWPGNVRELEHAIEHASILSKSGLIRVQDLPPELIEDLNFSSVSTIPPLKMKLTLDEALVISHGNKSQTAKLLGISRRTLYRHLDEGSKKEKKDVK
ncbi:MAG TPA: sigma-54-dependent Fis family transcriptional regulator [Desulfobulbaceae bacterium]|nr:sigma-54-dependent Fis family transcriptional regulator [Desulfobulbaceae bacterium]